MWKQPKYPLTGERIRKTWYVHTMEYLLSHKKERNNAISSNMDLEIIILSAVNQTNKNAL